MLVNGQLEFSDNLIQITWDPPHPIEEDKKASILDVLKKEAYGEYPNPDKNDPYWFGLKAARFARMALIAD